MFNLVKCEVAYDPKICSCIYLVEKFDSIRMHGNTWNIHVNLFHKIHPKFRTLNEWMRKITEIQLSFTVVENDSNKRFALLSTCLLLCLPFIPLCSWYFHFTRFTSVYQLAYSISLWALRNGNASKLYKFCQKEF